MLNISQIIKTQPTPDQHLNRCNNMNIYYRVTQYSSDEKQNRGYSLSFGIASI